MVAVEFRQRHACRGPSGRPPRDDGLADRLELHCWNRRGGQSSAAAPCPAYRAVHSLSTKRQRLGRRRAGPPQARDRSGRSDGSTGRVSPRNLSRTWRTHLGRLPIPPVDETKHFKINGTTSAGKSTTIRELLTGALGRGDGAVIADPDGDYLARFYDPARGDLILNPFDERSARWDLFAGIPVPQAADQLARSMIPDYDGKAPTWTAAASRASNASPRYAALTATQFLKASLRTAGTHSSYAALRVSTAAPPHSPPGC